MIFGDLGCLGDLITRNARKFPEKEGFVFEEVRLSWKQINERVNCFANGILKLGLKPKATVAILGKSSHRYLEVFFGVAKTGLVLVKLNYRLGDRELAYILNDSEANAIIFDGEYAEKVRGLSHSVPSLKYFICLDQPVEGALEYEPLIAKGEKTEPVRDIQGDDLVMIQYTSGTTGKPKGVMITHRGQILLANNRAMNCGSHRMLTPFPFFGAAATGRTLSHTYLGNTIVILREFEPVCFLETIQKERITWTILSPTIFYMLKEKVPHIGDYDTRSLKYLVYGGSPITPNQLRIGLEIFKGCQFENAYGLTETGPYGTVLMPGDHRTQGSEKEMNRLGSVGRMGINGLLKVVGTSGEDLLPGQIGEIAIYCDSNMVGYWKQPEETQKALRDGWVFTGDMGELDEEGYLFLRDRKAHMIISGGFNIFPKEIEDVLMEHPAVEEAAVIGIPDEKWGESVLALVIAKEGRGTTEQELIEHCRIHLASYKKPKRVEFVKEFPRTAMHKIQKHDLRARYAKVREGEFNKK